VRRMIGVALLMLFFGVLRWLIYIADALVR
jgi:hypothetical protein